MNEKPENPIDEGPPARESTTTSAPRNRAILLMVSVLAIVGVVAISIFLFWPRRSAKLVPAPRTVTFEETSAPSATAEDEKLILTPEQVRSAGLKIENVGERPTVDATSPLTTGTIQANSYKDTPVVSVVGGIVRSVGAELGENVRRGQRLAVVFSNELSDAQSRYLAAVATLDEHHRHHMRTIKLVDIGAASRQDLEIVTSQYREAESTVANLRQKLLLLGMSSERIASLNSTSQISSEVYVTSPSSGTVTSRTVNTGEVIDANRELMRVTDLSTVWVVGQVYEKDLAMVRVGSGANITSDAYPGRVFRGRVSYVDPKIDVATRTAQVRIELANPGQMFKIGMYVSVAFGGLGAAEKTIAVVPKAAVQSMGTDQLVFLATDKATEFIVRRVRLGPETMGIFPVLSGLNTGDRVVTEGSFLLRAELMKQHPTMSH